MLVVSGRQDKPSQDNIHHVRTKPFKDTSILRTVVVRFRLVLKKTLMFGRQQVICSR